jgi:hypothetical protein
MTKTAYPSDSCVAVLVESSQQRPLTSAALWVKNATSHPWWTEPAASLALAKDGVQAVSLQ